MTKKSESNNHNKNKNKKHILMHDYQNKKQDSHVGHNNLKIILLSVLTGITQRTINCTLCTDLRSIGRLRALTAMSAVPEQHEETAGH